MGRILKKSLFWLFFSPKKWFGFILNLKRLLFLVRGWWENPWEVFQGPGIFLGFKGLKGGLLR